MAQEVSSRGIRGFGVILGDLEPGPHNAITDVPGVAVGHDTVILDEPAVLRTGVTIVRPCPDIIDVDIFAGVHVLNGSGEMSGAMWVDESGLLSSPIALTSTHSLGAVRDALIRVAASKGREDRWWLPVVAETYDGWLSDGAAARLGIEHVERALDSASTSEVAEGCVGGGTGMICHGFKAGIGTSSRQAEAAGSQYTVGVLVQANYGLRHQLTVDGVKVGKLITADQVPTPERSDLAGGSSIIVVIATDAPLNGTQCQRLARRATIGLARAGGLAHDGSGDIFIAFSVATKVRPESKEPFEARMLPNSCLNQIFAAVADSTEEAILNALVAARDMSGRNGRSAWQIPHALLRDLLTANRPRPAIAV
jgi:D-aminopeptidase